MKAKELADRLTEVQFEILGTHWPASKAQALVHSLSDRLPEKKIKRRADLTGQGMRYGALVDPLTQRRGEFEVKALGKVR